MALFNKIELRNALSDVIATSVTKENVYTPRTYDIYTINYNKANEVLNNFFTSNDKIEEASENLEESFKNLEILPDKSKLEQKYNDSKQIDIINYIPNSTKLFEQEILDTKIVLENENATIEMVDNAVVELENSINQLIQRPDKTELNEIYIKLTQLDKNKYISYTTGFIDKSIQLIKETLENENATKDDIDNIISETNNYLSELILKGDKSKLNHLLKKANDKSKDLYTTTTYNNLQKTLNEINDVVINDDVTQEEVDNAVNVLNGSLNQLKKVTKGVYRITITYSLISNNSVGNEWSKTTYYNGKSFNSGKYITAKLNSTITLKSKIIEDDTYPDVGSSTVTLQLKDNYSKSTIITITENRGRYTGNSAKWKVTYKVTCIEKK